MEQLGVRELTNDVERELISMGYTEETLRYYRINWKTIFTRLG